MKITLDIDDELLKRATELTGIKEKAALVRLGLEVLIVFESERRLAKLGGSEPNLQSVRRRRSTDGARLRSHGAAYPIELPGGLPGGSVRTPATGRPAVGQRLPQPGATSLNEPPPLCLQETGGPSGVPWRRVGWTVSGATRSRGSRRCARGATP